LILSSVLGVFLITAFYCGIAAAGEAFPFRPGEKLTYRAQWGVIPAGEVTIEVLPIEFVQGTRAYHFRMVTKTNEAVDLVYKVRERQDSYISADMIHSILYTKKAEGKYPRDIVITFDWNKLEATRSNFGEKMAPIHIPSGSFDPLALFFVIRLQDLKKNPVLEIPITEGDRNIRVRAMVEQRETIVIEGKSYDTFKVTPDMALLEEENVVKKSDEPQLEIWFTADDKRIPVKIQSKVKIGYFNFQLVSVE
jgi:hypothetical protein